ncbi:hypothetical protein B0T24DRAFT_685223 [Lasiosphaeria ovina]|uniref:Uncharacterized protein n=1 Tax=Lasiosphaeria ovina TaxID=92902 RepID=A0AAE0JSR8_9PEZI|nr:hypothetical protein B0T24DRAFT_685223 [Lasiosphaeria ovina]
MDDLPREHRISRCHSLFLVFYVSYYVFFFVYVAVLFLLPRPNPFLSTYGLVFYLVYFVFLVVLDRSDRITTHIAERQENTQGRQHIRTDCLEMDNQPVDNQPVDNQPALGGRREFRITVSHFDFYFFFLCYFVYLVREFHSCPARFVCHVLYFACLVAYLRWQRSIMSFIAGRVTPRRGYGAEPAGRRADGAPAEDVGWPQYEKDGHVLPAWAAVDGDATS